MVTHDIHAAARASRTLYLNKGQLSTKPSTEMKYFYLIFSNLKRKKLRTGLTLLSIMVAFLLFGYLAAIRQAFNAGVESRRRRPPDSAPQGFHHPIAAAELRGQDRKG